MGSAPEHNDPDIPVVVGRRSARLSVIVPIAIRGTDVKGLVFKENTWTIGVNKHGGKLATFHQLTPGDQIAIENPVLGRTAKARVIRVGEKRFPEDPYEISVELLEAQNVWGVKFPPEDWQKERPYMPGDRAPDKAAPPLPTPSAPGSPAASPAEEASNVSAPTAVPAESNERSEKFNQFNLALAALSRYAEQAAGTVQAPRPAEEKPVQPPEQVTPSPPTALHDVLRLLGEKAKMVRSLEEQLEGLAQRLQATRNDLLGLLLKAEGVQQDWPAQLEKVQQNLQQASRQTLQSALEKLDEKVQEKLASASSALLEEARTRILDEASSAAESLSKRTAARLAEFTEESIANSTSELKARQTQATEQAKVETARLMESMIVEVNERFRQRYTELLPSLRADAEKSLEATAKQLLSGFTQSFREQIHNVAWSEETAVRESLQEMQRAMREEAENAGAQLRQISKQETDKAATTIAECVAQATGSANLGAAEATARLHTANKMVELSLVEAESGHRRLADLAASAAEGFRHEAETLVRTLRAELEDAVRQAREKSATESSEQIHKIAEGVLESSVMEVRKQVHDALEMLSEQLVTSEKGSVAKTKQQLDALTEGALAFLTREAQASREAFRDQLRKTLQEFQDRHAHDVDAQLQTTLEKQRGAFLRRVQEEAESSSQRAAAQLKTKAEQIAQETSDMMFKQVGVAVVAARDWAEGTRALLEARFQKSCDTFQKQMEDASKVALEKHRTELGTLAEGLHDRLQRAAHLFQATETVVETRVPKAAEDFPQTFSSQRPRSVEEELEVLVMQWKAKQEQAVRDAEEAFRRRLAEILRALQPTRK